MFGVKFLFFIFSAVTLEWGTQTYTIHTYYLVKNDWETKHPEQSDTYRIIHKYFPNAWMIL